MTIGDILTAENYTQGAIWCNQNDAHIERINNQYTIVANDIGTLDDHKATKIAEFKSKRDTEEIANIEYNGNTFDYDSKSRERLLIARQALEDAGGGSIVWTTADNQRVELTVTDFAGINAMAAARSNALHVKYNDLKTQVMAAETQDALDAIVWE